MQEALLESGARLQPYLDMEPTNSNFKVLQRIGSTGIMLGEGKTIGWSNEMRFRSSDRLKWNELYLEDYYGEPHNNSSETITGADFVALVERLSGKTVETNLRDRNTVTRLDAAKLIDEYLDPFHRFDVALDGSVLSK